MMAKQTKWKALVCLLCLTLAFGAGLVSHDYLGFHFPSRDNVLPVTLGKRIDPEAARQAELELIRLDLNEYTHLSTNIKNEITTAISDASEKYKLPPALLHSIFQIESDYHFNIDHPTVTVVIHGKKVTTSCKGLGGILFEAWAEKLKVEGIAETATDLYMPRCNILATGFILRTIINDELAASHGRADSWIVQRIITKYYGVKSPAYEAKMKQVTSNLWLKRMAREIVDVSVVPTVTDTAVQHSFVPVPSENQ